MYVSIGSGSTRYKDVINYDINKMLNVDIVGDIRKLPFKDDSVDGIIFQHVLEHLIKKDHLGVLWGIRRVLKPGGKLLVEVPNFEMCLRAYLDNTKGLKDSYWYDTIFGADRVPYDRHLSGITEEYLTDLLFETGFCDLNWQNPADTMYQVIAKKGKCPTGRLGEKLGKKLGD